MPCRTGESNLRRRRAGPMPYQVIYISFFFFLHSTFRLSATTTYPQLSSHAHHSLIPNPRIPRDMILDSYRAMSLWYLQGRTLRFGTVLGER